MSPEDEKDIMRRYEMLRGTDRPGYETVGRFEVPDAQRIIDRLNEEHIPFEIDAPYENQRFLPVIATRIGSIFMCARNLKKELTKSSWKIPSFNHLTKR